MRNTIILMAKISHERLLSFLNLKDNLSYFYNHSTQPSPSWCSLCLVHISHVFSMEVLCKFLGVAGAFLTECVIKVQVKLL